MMATDPSKFRTPFRAWTEPPFVVLAEDDDEIRAGLEEIFSRDGFQVQTVSDGERLVEFLGRCEESGRLPDVIVTDHRMPGYSSIEVLEGLLEAGWRVPVIVVTAFGGEVRQVARALGARAVLEKPFDPDDLRTAVLYWAEWSKRHAADTN